MAEFFIDTVVDDECVADVMDGWERLWDWAEDYTNDVGGFNHEEFRKTMLMTWGLFAKRIDFECPDEDYKLPIDLATILGQIMEYANRRQICWRKDGGDIGLSAMIVEAFWSSIRFRDGYSRDKAVIDFKEMRYGQVYRFIYDIEEDKLYVQSGNEPGIDNFSFDLGTGELEKIEENTMEPIVVDDISHWWYNDDDDDVE